jgi:hypothetical protein
MTTCKLDDALRMVVHKFPGMERTCCCGQTRVGEPVYVNFGPARHKVMGKIHAANRAAREDSTFEDSED